MDFIRLKARLIRHCGRYYFITGGRLWHTKRTRRPPPKTAERDPAPQNTGRQYLGAWSVGTFTAAAGRAGGSTCHTDLEPVQPYHKS